MPYRSDIHHRRSIRLPDYDYAQAGAYFVTLCTQGRECLFGDVMDGVMQLNDAGLVAEKCWLEIPAHFPRVVLDAVVIMPNHVHGILVITDSTVGANDYSPLHSPRPTGTSGTIGSVVRGFKIGVTKWMRQNTSHYDVWQRDYYEHIIRNEESLRRIREYIVNNPLQWMLDRENPDVAAPTGRGEKYFAPTCDPTNTCEHTNAPTSIPADTCDGACDHANAAASTGRGEKYFAPTCDPTNTCDGANAPTCAPTKDES